MKNAELPEQITGNPQVPKGHVAVAMSFNFAPAFDWTWWAALSRDPDGGYWLAHGLGNDFLPMDNQTNERSLRRFVRPLEREEAIVWLERELIHRGSKGDSPYCRDFFVLNREEIRRLLGNPVPENYHFISSLLCDHPSNARGASVRGDQIPFSGIRFTDMPPDRTCRDNKPFGFRTNPPPARAKRKASRQGS